MSKIKACPRCLALSLEDKLRIETVQPLPQDALAPMGPDKERCCRDCASADTLMKLRQAPSFESARIAVANDRQEQYRVPGAPLGLVGVHIMHPSKPGDHEKQIAWLDSHNWFGKDDRKE